MDNPARGEVLESALRAFALSARVIAQPEFCDHWSVDEPEWPHGILHLIDRGECWISGSGLDQPVRLGAGDLLILPRGCAHRLHSAPGGGRGGYSSLICAEIHFDDSAHNPLLGALPDALVVRSDEAGDALRCVAAAMSHTAALKLPGHQVALDRLTDSLFVMAFCAHAHRHRTPSGLLAALSDPGLARALASLHREPGRDWQVCELAATAAMSRTTFATRFSHLMGQTPYQYLTHWRMAEARRRLRCTRASVAAIAEALGYRSEAAFRRTFKRVQGIGPGAYRRRH